MYVFALVPFQVNGTSKKLYVVPAVRPVSTCDVAGAVGKLVGVMVTSVPVPAAGAVAFVEESVGVAVE